MYGLSHEAEEEPSNVALVMTDAAQVSVDVLVRGDRPYALLWQLHCVIEHLVEELKMHLENEGWALCPVKPTFKVSLPG